MTCQLHLSQNFFAANSGFCKNLKKISQENICLENANNFWAAKMQGLADKSSSEEDIVTNILNLASLYDLSFVQTPFLEQVAGYILAKTTCPDLKVFNFRSKVEPTNSWRNRVVFRALAKRGSLLLEKDKIISSLVTLKVYLKNIPVSKRPDKLFELLKAAFEMEYETDWTSYFRESYSPEEEKAEREEVILFLLSQLQECLLPREAKKVSWLWSRFFSGAYEILPPSLFVEEKDRRELFQSIQKIAEGKMSRPVRRKILDVLDAVFQKEDPAFNYRQYQHFLLWMYSNRGKLPPLWGHHFITETAAQLGLMTTEDVYSQVVFWQKIAESFTLTGKAKGLFNIKMIS